MTTLSIPATPIEPALDLTIIRGAVWLFMGNECRPLTTEQTQAVADFVVNAADALVDAR